MNISENGIKLLIENEGFRNKAYPDSRGLMTIGIGHLIKPNEPELMTRILTDEKVYDIFKKDISNAERWINDNCKWSPNQNQFDALCSFLHQYNIDSGRYKNTRNALISGNIAEIKRILAHDFNHVDVVKKDNMLVKRRARELSLFNKPC